MGACTDGTGTLGPMGLQSDRRSQILRCAKEIFAKKGFHSASVADLISRAGIARGTFYLYFTSKRDIFDILVDDLLQELDHRIQPIELGSDAPSPLAQVKANLRRILELMVSEPELIQILLHHASGLDQQSAAVVRKFYDRVLILIERSLTLGMQMGLVRKCHTEVAAACILGTVKEVGDWVTAHRREPPGLDALAEEIVDFGLRGLLAER